MNNQENKEMEKVVEKIRKLLAKSESAKENGSVHEAESFALKAQELLLQYNLSQQDIHQEEKSAIEMEIVKLDADFTIQKTEGPWITDLFIVLSNHNLCRVIIYGNRNNNMVYIFGERHNIEIVKYMHSQILTKIKKLSLEAWKEYFGLEKRNTFLRGYKVGVVKGINSKLYEQQRHQMSKYSGMAGLVKVNDQAITQKIQEEIGPLRRSKKKSLKGDDGKNKGYQDGKNMQLNKGISGSQRSSSNLLN